MLLWRRIGRGLSGTAEIIASKARRNVARTWKRHASSLVFGSVLVLVLTGFLVVPWYHWNALIEWSGLSNGELARNLALTCVAALAFVLAFWRSSVASRQAAQGDEGLRNERYQRGAEMLGSSALASRLGGVCALEGLARERPEEYYRKAQDLLCAFVRNPTVEGEVATSQEEVLVGGKRAPRRIPSCRDDVQEAVSAMTGGRDKLSDETHGFEPDLSEANLEHAFLPRANLSKANLFFASLSFAQLQGADLSGADLSHCDLTEAKLNEADLSNAILFDATLNRANLCDVKGLTQRQLDTAATDKGVPDLDGAFCAVTGEPLD